MTSWIESLKQYNQQFTSSSSTPSGNPNLISPSPSYTSSQPSPHHERESSDPFQQSSESIEGASMTGGEIQTIQSQETNESAHAQPARAKYKEQEVLYELRELYKKEMQAKQLAAKLKAQKTKESNKKRATQKQNEIPRFYIKRTTSPPPAEPTPAADESASQDNPDQPPPAPAAPVLSLATQLRREARTRYLITRAEQLLDDRELGILWETIQIHSVDTNTNTGAIVPTNSSQSSPSLQPANSTSNTNTGNATGGSTTGGPATQTSLFDVEKRLNYDSFLLISHSLPPIKSQRYFKPSTFLSFPQDSHGRISSRALWRYVTKKIQLTRLRISLTCYDDIGYGYLREQDLENYVYDQLSTLPPLQSLERDFYPYYVFTAVRKFIFFLDPHRRGKLRIKSIVESGVMLEFDALRYPHGHHQGTKKNSWFSAQHTQDVYAIYLGLDSNQNGMLSREEFKAYNGGNLTQIFIDGLFAEYRMYPSSSTNTANENEGKGLNGTVAESDETLDDSDNPNQSNNPDSSAAASPNQQRNELEMDYKTFLDFVLAMEYKTTPASIAYFFKILDINHQGYLDTFTLNYWFRAVSEKMAQLGHEQVDIADVVANEIFDMVCPSQDGRITLNDLISSRCGHTVISILIDVNGFWKYDNRESLMQHEEEDN